MLKALIHSVSSALAVCREIALEILKFVMGAARSRTAQTAEILFLRKQLPLLPRAPDQAAQVQRCRKAVPGALVSAVRLERGLGHRQARNSDSLASKGFPAFLAVEVSGGKTATSEEDPSAHCSDGSRESNLGTGTSCSRTVLEVGDLRLTTHGARLLACLARWVPCHFGGQSESQPSAGRHRIVRMYF
jgi:hypothetical protein